MISKIMYIELKTGYNDDGPAWIGYVKASRTMRTVYFNDRAFRKSVGNGANFYDIETGEEYWISGIKKSESNRHPAGRGVINIDSRAAEEFMSITGISELKPSMFNIIDIEDNFPIERINRLENGLSE